MRPQRFSLSALPLHVFDAVEHPYRKLDDKLVGVQVQGHAKVPALSALPSFRVFRESEDQIVPVGFLLLRKPLQNSLATEFRRITIYRVTEVVLLRRTGRRQK